MWLFALFLGLPLIEIALFVVLGGMIGLWLTLAFVLGSAMLGVALIRRSGRVLPVRGAVSLRQIAGSGFAMVAALLLILPGFLTSAIGLLLMVAPVQRLVVLLVGQRLAARGMVFQSRSAQADVIDGEFEEVTQPRDEGLPPSRWTQG